MIYWYKNENLINTTKAQRHEVMKNDYLMSKLDFLNVKWKNSTFV